MIQVVTLTLLVLFASATNIHPISPPELFTIFKEPMATHVSPIGFRPLSGRLQGLVILADPAGACSKIKSITSENQDFFILADDTQCLQSVKAKNIAASGGYAGIIKQNPNNTLFDKEISLVHIPILQIKAEDYDNLVRFITANPETKVTISIDFTDHSQTHPVNLELWFSPTEKQSYEFLFEMQDFLAKQEEIVSFTPHYVLQSQRESKNYIGCLSSGRYCPSEIEYEGRYEGKNIVEQTLRQIVIWDTDRQQWWKYVNYFYSNCLKNTVDVFLNTTKLHYCVENSLIMSGINSIKLTQDMDNSFLGKRKEVDDNTYLLQERQHFVREKISSHPTVLVNKKTYDVDSAAIQGRVCKMQGDQPSEMCSGDSDQLTSTQILIIITVIIALFITIAALYKLYMHVRMRKEIKGEVDKTLEQYYRYISTFEGDDGKSGKSKKQKKFKKLNEEMQEVIEVEHEEKPKEVEMAKMEGEK